jgi:hypothetical protein
MWLPGWIEMDRQAWHSHATSKVALLRNVECSIFNEGKEWAGQEPILNVTN